MSAVYTCFNIFALGIQALGFIIVVANVTWMKVGKVHVP